MSFNPDHPCARRHNEEFESFVERALFAIYERQVNMSDAEGRLAADVDEIAAALPIISGNLENYLKELAEKEAALQQAIADKEAAEAKDATAEAELATAKGELAQVEATTARLDPVAAEAAKLAGTGTTGTGDGSGAEAGAGDGSASGPGDSAGAGDSTQASSGGQDAPGAAGTGAGGV